MCGFDNTLSAVSGSSSSACTRLAVDEPRPDGVVVDGRPAGQPHAGAALEKPREPLDQMTDDVAGGPPLHGRRCIPVAVGDAIHQFGEVAGDLAVFVGCCGHWCCSSCIDQVAVNVVERLRAEPGTHRIRQGGPRSPASSSGSGGGWRCGGGGGGCGASSRVVRCRGWLHRRRCRAGCGRRRSGRLVRRSRRGAGSAGRALRWPGAAPR